MRTMVEVRGGQIQDLREQLSEVGFVLELKKDEVAEKFSDKQLRAYFRSKDAIRLLIPSLYDLEIALYESKIAM